MGRRSFKAEYLEFSDHLGGQKSHLTGFYDSEAYLIPQQNLGVLEKTLSLLSCKTSRLDGKSGVPASKLCKLCSGDEYLDILRAGDNDGRTMFLGFPRALYSIESRVSVDIETVRNILRTYLATQLYPALEEKSIEGLSSPERIDWQVNILSLDENPTSEDIEEFWRILDDLDRITKGKLKPYNEFGLCSGHNTESNLSSIREGLVKEVLDRFNEHSIELQERDVRASLSSKKIFPLGFGF